VNLKRTLDLSAFGSSQTANAIRAACLAEHDLVASMDLARELETAGTQGLLFPSVVGGDGNLVVYLANCSRKTLVGLASNLGPLVAVNSGPSVAACWTR